MREILLAELARRGGVLSRAQARRVVAEHVIDDAVRARAIARVFRGVYCLPGRQADRDVRRRAALLAVPGSALSHYDALATMRMLDEDATPSGPVHLTVRAGAKRPGRQAGLRVHRRTAMRSIRLATGHVIVDPHQAAVESWPLLPDDVRRNVVLAGVRNGLLTTTRLRQLLARNTKGAREIRGLLDLIDAGCQSALEIFGLVHVFTHASLPPSIAQRQVRVRGRTIRLDRAYDDVLVGVELDGAAYHFGREQRERDMRRDAQLAALGWLVLRFSYRRIVDDPEGVRREIAEVIAARRRQFRKAVGS